MLLAVHAEINIIDDVKGLDAGKLRVLGRIGEMCLKKEAHVQIKKEPLSFLSKASLFGDEQDDEADSLYTLRPSADKTLCLDWTDVTQMQTQHCASTVVAAGLAALHPAATSHSTSVF